jgi:polysaccharide biosynthesis/export protein
VGRGMRVLILALLILSGTWAKASAQELQPGDSIAISVYQDSKLDRQVVVGPTGFISFPLVGQLKASGLTPQALEKALRSKLRDKYTGGLDITVALIASAKQDEEQKPRFYVTGEVTKPGPYVLRPGTTVMQAIAMSGGLGQFAARKRIQIRRRVAGAESTLIFNYGAFESGADVKGNIELQADDVIIVPEKSFWE